MITKTAPVLAAVLALMIVDAALSGAEETSRPGQATIPADADPEAVKHLEKAYPKPAEGMLRAVIFLPHKERGAEDDFKVEVVVGKTIVTDGINRYAFGGTIEEKDIPGWGFSFLEAKCDFDKAASTLMAGTENPAARFVAGPSTIVRYNSRLPLVVYAPKGAEIRYRIWQASPELQAAAER
jgi:ecotin